MSQVGKFLNLKPHMSSWRVYNQNGPYTTAYSIGSLAPAQFGGLSYRIRGEKGNDVYLIQTESFSLCAIWAPRDNDSTITSSPAFPNGDTSNAPIKPPTPLELMNQTGFAKYFKNKFTAIPQSVTVLSTNGITVKVSASLSASSGGGNDTVATFNNGVLSDISYKNQINNITAALSKKGLTLSKNFGSIAGSNFNGSVTTNGSKTIVSLSMSTPITGYSSANQTLTIEFDEPKLKSMTETERQAVYADFKTVASYAGLAILAIALILALVATGAGPLIALGTTLTGYLNGLWAMLLGLLTYTK